MAINKEILLPKAILMVLENDILNAVNHYNPGISLLCGKVMEWLTNQFHRIITAHKEKLPSKARKFKYPHILWIAAPNHIHLPNINEFRDKFNISMKNCCSMYREMSVINLSWDAKDTSLVGASGKYTSKGMATFWMKVNEAFQDWDKEQMRLSHLGKTPSVSKPAVVNSCVGTKKKKETRIVNFREHATESGKFNWKPQATKFKIAHCST